MEIMRRLMVGVLLGFAFVGGACSSDDGGGDEGVGASATTSTTTEADAGSDPTTDAAGVCGLVSTGEMAEVLGVDVTATSNEGGSDTCNWLTSDGELEVVLTRSTPGNFDTCGAEADPTAAGVLQPVDELDAESYWSPPGGDPLATLTSCVGEEQWLLTMAAVTSFDDESAVRDQAVAVMDQALANA